MNPSWRKPAGILLIVLLIAGWSILVVTCADLVEGAPWPVLVLFYASAGIGWALPLKPLIRWMSKAGNNA